MVRQQGGGGHCKWLDNRREDQARGNKASLLTRVSTERHHLGGTPEGDSYDLFTKNLAKADFEWLAKHFVGNQPKMVESRDN